MSSLAGDESFDYEGPYRAWVEAGKQVPEPSHPSWCDEELCFYAGAGQWSHVRRFEDQDYWVEIAWLEHTRFEDRNVIHSDAIDFTPEEAVVYARLLYQAATFRPEEENSNVEKRKGSPEDPGPMHPSWCDKETCFWPGEGPWAHYRRFRDKGFEVDLGVEGGGDFKARKLHLTAYDDLTPNDAADYARLLLRAASFQAEEREEEPEDSRDA